MFLLLCGPSVYRSTERARSVHRKNSHLHAGLRRHATMSDSADRQKIVLEKYLQGLHQEDGYWHGYLKSNDEVQHFERSLAAVNVKYSVRTSKEVSNSRKGKHNSWTCLWPSTIAAV